MKKVTNIICLALFIIILILSHQLTISAEIYPTQVTLKILSNEEIIGQDELFDILEMDEYVLVPLVSLSKWVEIELNYEREKELLTVYYEDTDKTIQIDLQYGVYYDFPEWSTEPPVTLEGDFYVTTSLIEYLLKVKVLWAPRNQELILDYDYVEKKAEEEEIIKKRPEELEIKPDITGDRFSFGSIHHKSSFKNEYIEDTEDNFQYFNNLIYIHGRAGDWTLSAGQEVEYDINNEVYELEYPLLGAKNSENNRLIIIGDNRFSLPNTLDRINLRGLYVQYPLQQISERRAYTSIRGKAEEGSTVYLFDNNDKKIDEQYIYQGEKEYYFKNISLTENRTNIFKIVIEYIDGSKKEILKEIPGSLNIYEENTREGVFAFGRYNNDKEPESLLDVGGMQFKYAPSSKTSYLWELGVESIFEDNKFQGVNAGSLLRLSNRSSNRPLVFYIDWLAGSDTDLVDYGYRVNGLYTRKDGYISGTLSYIPPIVEDNVESDAGQQFISNYEKEINENWLMDIELESLKSILDMDKLDLKSINLGFDYSDKARNKLKIETQVGQKQEDVDWKVLDLTEKNRNWINFIVDGRTFKSSTRFDGELKYEIADVYFYENETNSDIKREDSASVNMYVSKNLTDDLILIGNFDSEYIWLEGSRLESESDVDIRARLKTGNYTSITAGISNETEFDKNNDGNENVEEVQELELFLRHVIPRNLTLTTGIKKTYLAEESYFSGNFDIDYHNSESDWEASLEYEYIDPYGGRSTPQQVINLEISRYLFSGWEGSFNIERSYDKSTSEVPEYEATISLSQALGFANGYIKGQRYNGDMHSSYIAGLVYLDENNNNKRDPEEILLEGINLSSGRLSTFTDKDGYFIFEDVRNGIHEVGIELDKLKDDYRVVTENKVVEVRENENIFLELGLTKLGEIKGKVYIEEKAQEDSEKISLSHIGIIIEELNKTLFTRSDGTFNFKYIPLGNYTIKIMESSLPIGLRISGENEYKIDITLDELTAQDINIPLIFDNKNN